VELLDLSFHKRGLLSGKGLYITMPGILHEIHAFAKVR
jgi:hypothetical protein